MWDVFHVNKPIMDAFGILFSVNSCSRSSKHFFPPHICFIWSEPEKRAIFLIRPFAALQEIPLTGGALLRVRATQLDASSCFLTSGSGVDHNAPLEGVPSSVAIWGRVRNRRRAGDYHVVKAAHSVFNMTNMTKKRMENVFIQQLAYLTKAFG